MDRKYYEAYEERYKTIHEMGFPWSGDEITPIVLQMLDKYDIDPADPVLEIGCGEGRDARAVLHAGYNLTATDISPEAISYCKNRMGEFAAHFHVLDCLSERLEQRYRFIYAIAVIHMLVVDADRDGFYQFIRNQLAQDGLALICTMGDGTMQMQSDITQAFTLQERNHESGKVMVAGTSCRMVTFPTFEEEIARNGLQIVEKGLTEAMPHFNVLMYAVVRRKQEQSSVRIRRGG